MRTASLVVLLALAAAARADLPSPRFDRLAPLGAAAGSAVEVEAAGADLEDATTLLFDHPGITATHVKDRRFEVAVAPDVPPGTYDGRLVGKYGVTNPRLFAVQGGPLALRERHPPVGGFDGPVTIAAEGLPNGLHAAPTTLRWGR